MTAFRMMKPLHGQKMYVELLGRAESQALYLPWGCSSHQIHRGIISLLPNLQVEAGREAVHDSKAVDEESRWRLQKDWQSLCALQARQGTGGDY